MKPEDFVTAIRKAVHEASIEGMEASLVRPPGRRPHEKLRKLSSWFNALSEIDRQNTVEVIRLSVHASIMNMLSVLDGVIAVESIPDKGEIRLIFVKDGKVAKLNDTKATEMLHDIYQLQVQDEVFGKS
jgi:hypothetical protein